MLSKGLPNEVLSPLVSISHTVERPMHSTSYEYASNYKDKSQSGQCDVQVLFRNVLVYMCMGQMYICVWELFRNVLSSHFSSLGNHATIVTHKSFLPLNAPKKRNKLISCYQQPTKVHYYITLEKALDKPLKSEIPSSGDISSENRIPQTRTVIVFISFTAIWHCINRLFICPISIEHLLNIY